MPYLPLELDGKKAMAKVARACSVSPGDVMWGLSEVWEYVWTTKRDVLSPVVVLGCMGAAIPASILVAFGFLEEVEGGFRVKGADRLLKTFKARSEAGKKHAGNLAQNNRVTPDDPVNPSPPPPGDIPGDPAGSPPGLPPNTQHPTPNTFKPPPPTPSPPVVVVGKEFWDWAQGQRARERGLEPEAAPPKGWAEFWAVFGSKSKPVQSRAYGKFLLDKDFGSNWAMARFIHPKVYRSRLTIEDLPPEVRP